MEEPTRAAVLRFGALARLTRAHVLGDVDVLTHPEGEAPHQGPRLSPSEVPPQRRIVALAKHLRAQPAAGGDAQAVRRTLPAAIEETTTDQKRPAFRRASGAVDGGAAPVDELAKRSGSAAHDGPEERVDRQLGRQSLDERWR